MKVAAVTTSEFANVVRAIKPKSSDIFRFDFEYGECTIHVAAGEVEFHARAAASADEPFEFSTVYDEVENYVGSKWPLLFMVDGKTQYLNRRKVEWVPYESLPYSDEAGDVDCFASFPVSFVGTFRDLVREAVANAPWLAPYRRTQTTVAIEVEGRKQVKASVYARRGGDLVAERDISDLVSYASGAGSVELPVWAVSRVVKQADRDIAFSHYSGRNSASALGLAVYR